ncbi:MAG: UDP-glucose 4-epimerase GalE [Planctomycetota bacterium]
MGSKTSTVLVTGGAGYVGSHTVKRLRDEGHRVIVFDDLVEGHRQAVRGARLEVGDLAETDRLRRLCREERVEAAVHFAARCYVGESVVKPRKYFRDNVVGSLSLLEALADSGVQSLVFSSSCAVYGAPPKVPITEDVPRCPVNPYGWTKMVVEDMMAEFSRAYGLCYAALRYFNAAGADPEGELGEWHDPETHLIPLALRSALDPSRHLEIFGSDYPTSDGTCVRDYVHVTDLAEAHLLALEWLDRGGRGDCFNLGTGHGYSVKEVVETARAVTGRSIATRLGERRPGDPPVLVAAADKAHTALGWVPRYPDLRSIVEHAWQWLLRHPCGYEG